ncbi:MULTISPECIES: TRAP transporter large permease [Thauera]|mgnify:FL=1|jgi:tripartite ATP-independent transporter DctM subunit|uniref:TRAP transporter large permease protein n=2 Tax=Thauera aminoaromatica TaxID=164330 RepID=C4ZM09_THASP|nr:MULTISPECIES: TRAP transporter large permease [Thauera]MBP6543547.1 TRAP transporter large permease [Piscinibacter sp.]MDA0235823.1 TRAP transporter large permease [Pseudomonadota bacterium]OPZ04753.1 MAG: Sialic acid TRAP transporter permease protein SiaT [Alphaproteobacteria bacterium ADurb.BinA305]TMW74829.1 TRAP transporter large permease [Thauera sp. UPWRP]ACK54064.1 TRAP dicarboxylate transporter, DctM subunit [Thauera aminoaromatica]
MTVGLLSLLAVLVLAFLRVPLAFALLSVSLGGIGVVMGWDVARSLVPMTISEAVFSYELAVVPMFILMGNILARTGISDDLFRAANAFLGPVRGGLALSTMVTCAGFSAVCGSSLATAATMSKVAYPSMKRYGYSDALASATIAAGGTLGILIPPSIILMIYGILTQTNIGHLFVAGVVPGLLGLLMYLLVIYAVARISPQDAPRGERTTMAEKLHALRGVWPFTLLFVLIIGGLYGKLFTATEAAGMGAGLALILSMVQGRMSWQDFRHIFIETATTSVMLYSVLFGALLFAKLISFSGLGEGILELFNQAGLGPWGTIVAILVVFLLLGCVMDSLAIILICVPLFVPILLAHGFDLVWFGIIVVVVTEIALITPPIGMNVFVLKATLPHVRLGAIFRGLTPFIAIDLVRLALLVIFPSISLALVAFMK